MKASYLACEEGHSVQTGVQWREAHWNQITHLQSTSWHGTQHGLWLKKQERRKNGNIDFMPTLIVANVY